MITRNTILKTKHRIIYYDLETTGFNPFHNEIIEIGATDNFNNNFNLLIKSKTSISKKIEKITGITNKLVLEKGLKPEIAFKNFIEYILYYNKLFNNKIYLVAHNNDAFDKQFLIFQFKKYNINIPNNIVFIDSLRLAQFILPDLYSHSIFNLCKYYNIINENAHRALSDALVLKKIFRFLMLLFKQKFKTDSFNELLLKIKC